MNLRTLFISDRRPTRLTAYGLLLALCLITYNNTFHAKFMIDDFTIFFDPKIRNVEFLGFQLLPDKDKILDIKSQKSEIYYRPLAHAVLMVLYLTVGEDPARMHIFNLIFFWVLLVVLFEFILLVFRDIILALCAGSLFCVHPIHGVFLNYITAIVFSLELIFMLLSLMSFYIFLERTRRPIHLVLALAAYAASVMFHESAIFLPIYAAAFVFFILQKNWRQTLFSIAPYAAVMAVYLFLRMNVVSLKASMPDKLQMFQIGIFEYAASYTKIIVWYLAKLFYPDGIVFMWATPVVRDHVGLWLALLAVLLLLICVFIRFGASVIKLGVMWLAIGCLPVMLACLLKPTEGFLIEPHWLSFASIGFFISVAYLVRKIFESKKTVAVVLLAVILTLWGTTAYTYNSFWSDEKRYCRFWLDHAPDFRSVHFWLACAYMDEGNFAQAREHFMKTLPNHIYDRQIYNNLGLMEMVEKRWDKAKKYFLSALEIDPNSAYTHMQLGRVALIQNDYEGSKQAYTRALDIDRFQTEPRLKLAWFARQEGRDKDAEALYKENLAVIPHHGQTLFELADLYRARKDVPAFLTAADEIVKFNKDVSILTSIGSILAMEGHVHSAYEAFNRALRVDPQDKEIYLELGKLLGNLNRFDDAIRTWQSGAALDPQDPRFKLLIGQAEALKFQGADR